MDDAIAVPLMSIEDKSRLAATVAEQGPRLRAFVRRQVADLGEVDDIARNRIIDRFRSRSREVAWTEPKGGDEGSSTELAFALDAWRVSGDSEPEVTYANSVLADELVAAIDELPPDQREVFIAHELHGRSFKDLSAETGVAVNTLLGRKHAAVRHLRRRLDNIRSEFNL